MGFITGFYIFIFGYMPNMGSFSFNFDPRDIGKQVAFQIVADSYGGCMMASSCTSFVLDNDRGYRFFRPDGEVVTGILPEELMETIQKLVNVAPLDDYSEVEESKSCASYVDGVDYRYEITVSGETYILDTCKTALDKNSDFHNALLKIWQYLSFRQVNN